MQSFDITEQDYVNFNVGVTCTNVPINTVSVDLGLFQTQDSNLLILMFFIYKQTCLYALMKA